MNESIGRIKSFSFSKLPLMNANGIRKTLLGNHSSNDWFNQNLSVDARISGWMFKEEWED